MTRLYVLFAAVLPVLTFVLSDPVLDQFKTWKW